MVSDDIGGDIMHLKDIIIKAAVIVAIGAIAWYGLGLFNQTAEDNNSAAEDHRTSQHERIENMWEKRTSVRFFCLSANFVSILLLSGARNAPLHKICKTANRRGEFRSPLLLLRNIRLFAVYWQKALSVIYYSRRALHISAKRQGGNSLQREVISYDILRAVSVRNYDHRHYHSCIQSHKRHFLQEIISLHKKGIAAPPSKSGDYYLSQTIREWPLSHRTYAVLSSVIIIHHASWFVNVFFQNSARNAPLLFVQVYKSDKFITLLLTSYAPSDIIVT